MGHSPSDTLRVSEVRFSPATRADRAAGLMGWITFVLNGALKIDSVTLRRTRDGRLTLSYPSRRDRRGHEHFVIAPLGDEARVEIEKQVLAALDAEVAS